MALSMFLTLLATIYTSMCVNLQRGGVSTGIKRYAFLLYKSSSTSLNHFFFVAKHKESIFRKIVEGFDMVIAPPTFASGPTTLEIQKC